MRNKNPQLLDLWIKTVSVFQYENNNPIYIEIFQLKIFKNVNKYFI